MKNPTGGRSRDVAALFFATMFPQTVVSFISLAPPVMATEIARSLGLSPEIAGYYTGLVYLCVLVGNLSSARLIGRFGPLRLSFACVATGGLALAVFSSGLLGAMVAASLLIGLSYGPLTPASSQVIAGQAGSRSFNLVVSIRQTSVPLGGMLAGLVTPPLLLRLGWQGTCAAIGSSLAAAAVLCAFGLRLVRGERPGGADRRGVRFTAPILMIVRRPSLLALAVASFVYGAVQLVLNAFLVTYLTSVVGHDLVTAGALLGASQVSSVGARVLWGSVADRMARPERLMMLIGLGSAASCLLMTALALVGPTLLTLPVVILFGGTASGWNGVFLAEVMRKVDRAEAGLATSGFLFFTYAGVVVGPPAFGALASGVGLPGAFVAAAIVTVAGAVLAGASRRMPSTLRP